MKESRRDVSISALILAAGKGTRMKSALPKVLHPVLGRTMLEWVIHVVGKAGVSDVTLVLSSDTSKFECLLGRYKNLRICVQNRQRGTGDAVSSAAKGYVSAKTPSWASAELRHGEPSGAEWVLICAGDTPAMNPATIKEFIDKTLESGRRLAVLGMNVAEPKGYGRLVKATDGGLAKIVEERDADEVTRKVKLCNSGIILAKVEWLFHLLEGVSPSNSQNEYYLTDVFGRAMYEGESAYVFETNRAEEFAGVNDRSQLQVVEKTMLVRRMEELMSHGVTVHLPDTVFVEADSTIDEDSEIYPGVYLKGKNTIGRRCVIGPQVVLEDCVVGEGSVIGASAVLIRSTVSEGTSIPPLASMADVTM